MFIQHANKALFLPHSGVISHLSNTMLVYLFVGVLVSDLREGSDGIFLGLRDIREQGEAG